MQANYRAQQTQNSRTWAWNGWLKSAGSGGFRPYFNSAVKARRTDVADAVMTLFVYGRPRDSLMGIPKLCLKVRPKAAVIEPPLNALLVSFPRRYARFVPLLNRRCRARHQVQPPRRSDDISPDHEYRRMC
jgi:hypothetical protein